MFFFHKLGPLGLFLDAMALLIAIFIVLFFVYIFGRVFGLGFFETFKHQIIEIYGRKTHGKTTISKEEGSVNGNEG